MTFIRHPTQPALSEEIILKMFRSRDCTVSLCNQLSDWDSRLPQWKPVSTLQGLPWQNTEILAVVIIWSLISSVCGIRIHKCSSWHLQRCGSWHIRTCAMTHSYAAICTLSLISSVSGVIRHTWHSYNCFLWNCYTPKIDRIEKLRFLGISRYEFKLRFWFNLNLYRGIGVSGFDGFRGCSIFRGNCHTSYIWYVYVYVYVSHTHTHTQSGDATHIQGGEDS